MRCAIFRCNASSKGTNEGGKISFHSFPKDNNLCKRWVFLCQRTDKFSVKSARICSNHFNANDFVAINSVYEQHQIIKIKRLKPNVVPPLLLPIEDTISPQSARIQKRAVQSSSTVTEIGGRSEELHNPLIQMDVDNAASMSKEFCSGSSAMDFEERATFEGSKLTPVYNVACSTQTDSKNIPEKAEPTTPFHINRSMQTDAIIPSYTQLQNENIKLKIEMFKRENKLLNISNIFSSGQLKKLECPEKRNKWTSEDIAYAIAIHAAGPRAYRLLLKKKYPLPVVITLKKWCAKIYVYPGIL